MVRSFEEHFPDIVVPNREPDIYFELHKDFPVYKVWHPTETESGLAFAAPTQYNHDAQSANEDICTIQRVSQLGLKSVLDYVGIFPVTATETYPFDGSTTLAAMHYPNTTTYCERMNTLLHLEQGQDELIFQFEPYPDLDNPFYSAHTLMEYLARRTIPVASEPHMSRHDQAHGIAAYMSPYTFEVFHDQALQLLADKREGKDVQASMELLTEFHELANVIPFILEAAGRYAGAGGAVFWERIAMQDTTRTLVESKALVAERLHTTAKRIATLGLAA